MGKTRQTDHGLPTRLYRHHGGYRYVTSKNGTQNKLYLGRDRQFAISKAQELNRLNRIDRNQLVGRSRTIFGVERDKIFQRDNFKCVYCGAKDDLILNHFIPFKHGGATHPLNLVTCCVSCNDRKGDLNPDEFFAIVNELREHIFDHVFANYIPLTVQNSPGAKKPATEGPPK